MKSVLVAGIYHETHTFIPQRLGLSDFKVFGEDDLPSITGDGSPMDGVLEVGRQRGWDIHFARYLRASPGGTVRNEVLDFFVESLRSRISALSRTRGGAGPDGVCLVLHGAMVCEDIPDAEGTVIRQLRDLLGPGIPICGVLDLHANVTRDMVGENLGLVTYRENPHTDARQAAMDGAALLDRALGGLGIRSVLQQVPIVWPATGLLTGSDPMRRLEAMAREIEGDRAGILHVNVNAGYSFADIEDAGLSFSAITTGDAARALEVLRPLARYALAHKESGNGRDQPVDEVIRDIRTGAPGLVVVAEPADNIGGGGPGDCTGMLRALVEHRIGDSVITINDPESVRILHERKAGETCRIHLGGKTMADDSPVDLEVEIVQFSDGVVALEDARSHLASMYGATVDMGRCVLVRHGGVHVIVTSRKTEPFDLAVFRRNGISPEKMRCVVAKAAVGHKAAFAAIADRFLSVDTPGPCRSDLRRLPFKRIRRPIYPLDDI